MDIVQLKGKSGKFSAPRQRGAVAIEMILLLPALLLLVLAILDFGWAFFIKNTLNNAVREGARRGAIVPRDDKDQIDEIAVARTQESIATILNFIPSENVTVAAYLYEPGGTDPNVYVIVYGTIGPYAQVTPFGFIAGLLPTYLHARSTMRWELSPPT